MSLLREIWSDESMPDDLNLNVLLPHIPQQEATQN